MKLPSGKVTKTVAGGLDSFQGLLNDLKTSNFTGYLSIINKLEDAESKGQLVIKDGAPVLADHEFKGQENIGKDAVHNIIKDGLNSDASLEVHNNVDVDIIIDFNTDAQVEESDFDIASKAKEIEEEERKAKEEAERREKEKKRREELTSQMNEWKNSGYIISKLESALDGPLPELEKIFKEFGGAIQKLTELDKKLGELDTKGFESKVDEIELKLNNPEAVTELEKEIGDLEKAIASRAKKEAEFRKKIENWKNEGYNVSRLETVLETDFSKAWDEITVFMDQLQKLKEYEDRLKKLETKGFEPMVEHIQANLKNPDALEELDAQFADLEMRIKEAQERKAEFKKQVDEWGSQGYNIGRFKDLMKESLETVEQMIMDYDRDLTTLNEMKSQFDNLPKADIEAEAKALEPKFTNPDSIPQLTEELQKLTTKLGQIEEQKKGLIEQIEEWRNLGYNTVRLEPVLKDVKIEEIEKAVKDFEVLVGKLSSYETVLDSVNLVGFESEAEAIRSKLLDPEKLNELDTEMKDLKKKIDATEKKRAELKKRVEGWKNDGYIVESLEAIIDGDLKVAWDAFTTMMDQIQTLKGLKEKMDTMEVTGYEDEAEEVKNQLNDPEKAAELEKNITELDEKVQAEKARRAEIAEQVKKWKKEGFIIDALEPKLAGKLDELEPAFSEFNTKIEKLKEFKTKVSEMKTATYKEELKELQEKLKNPDLVAEVENDFNSLSKKIEEEDKIREELKDQVEAWKSDGFVTTMLESVIDGNINEARKVSTDLSDAINRLLEYRHKLGDLDLRDFTGEEDTVKKLSNDPANLDQIETIMKQLISKVEQQNASRKEMNGKIEGWRNEGLNVDEIDKRKDEQFSVFEEAFKKFEGDIAQLLELQKKLGGAAAVGKPAPPEDKEKAAAPEAAEGEAAKAAKEAAAETGEGAAAAAKKKEEVPEKEAEDVPKKLFSEFKLNKDFTFDTFVVGTSNRFTHAAALAVAESPADAYNPLFIYGGVGLGKTHLLNAIGNHILKGSKEANIIYVSSERFTNELINAVRYDKIDDFRNIYRTADVLIIDDIQFLAGKESTQEEFFHTFNTLYNAHKQIVVSSDRPPKEIPKLEERLRSRFEGGLITDIQPPSLETKVIILRREAKKQNIDPPDEVVHYIASKVKTNIRELRGYLTKISAYSSLTKQEITMELAENVLKDLGVEEPAEKPKEEAVKPKEEEAARPPPEAMDGKQKLSSIEERLSSLKARLSPILSNDKDKGGAPAAPEGAAPTPTPAEAPAKQGAAPSAPEQEQTSPVPRPEGTAPEPAEPPVAEPVATATSEAGEGAELAKCGNCGAIVPADVPECPECGVSFGGEWFECPECRSVVSADSMKCENCGAEFEAVGEEGEIAQIGGGEQAPGGAPTPVPTPQPEPEATPSEKKKKKKKKKKKS